MPLITSSEICVLKLIKLLVLGGREQRSEKHWREGTEILTPPIFASKETPLNIMCFLSDLYRLGTINRIKNLHEFLSLLQSYVPKREPEESVTEIMRSSLQFHSIDELEDTVESIPVLTTMPKDEHIIPNRAISPYVILPESLLGQLLRSISVRWQDLLFEDMCTLFDNFQEFMSNSIYVQDVGERRNHSSSLHTVLLPSCSQSYLDLLDIHSNLQDVMPAMDNLHRYYDSGKTSYDLLQLTSLSEYVLSVGPNPNRRHQQAMLSVATVWIRSGNIELAACAVEEALKQAHQRGDHASVSRALLLLQHILVLSTSLDTKTVLRKFIISTLNQLLNKCEELNLRTFASQARLLLSQAKMQAPLIIMDYGMAPTDNSCFEITDELDKFTPQEIWHDVLRVQSGENVATELSNTGYLCHQLQHPFKGHVKGPKTTEELGVTMPLSLCVASATFWCRLGIFLIFYHLVFLTE